MPSHTWVARGLIVLSVLVAAGCGSKSPAPPPSPSSPPEVITLSGGEALGLAIHGDNVWAISYQASTLSRVDPVAGRVTQTLSPGRRVATVISAGDSLWAASYGGSPSDSRIFRINPATGAVITSIDPGEVCCDLSAGADRIWAVDPRGTLLGIDPATNQIIERIGVPVDRATHTNVVQAGDSVWVSSDSTKLFRIRLSTKAIEQLDVGGGVPFLAKGGRVWGAAPQLIWAVDQGTGEVVERIPLANSMEVLSLAIADDAIWVGIRHPGYIGAVLRIDPATKAVVREWSQVEIPARIELGFGSVWITDSGANKLHRIQADAR